MLQLISATGQQTVDALAFLLAFALTEIGRASCRERV